MRSQRAMPRSCRVGSLWGTATDSRKKRDHELRVLTPPIMAQTQTCMHFFCKVEAEAAKIVFFA